MSQIQEIVVAVFGGGAFTLMLQHFFGFLTRRTKEQNNTDQKSRQDTRNEFQALFDLMKKDMASQHDRFVEMQGQMREREDICREELEACRLDLSKLWRKHEGVTVWMRYLEDVLRNAKIPFRPFSETGTDEHRALPKGEGI